MATNIAQDPRPNSRHERVVAPLVSKEGLAFGEVWPDASASEAEAGRQSREASDRRAGAAAADTDYFAGLQAVDPSLHVSERVSGFRNDPFVGVRPPIGSRMLRAVIRFCVVFLIGVGATLAWQSRGDEAVEMAKTAAVSWAPNWVPPAWFSSPSATSSVSTTKPPAIAPITGQAGPLPQPPPPAQPPAPAAAAAPPEVAQQMQSMVRDVAMVRHSLEQLAARQEEMAQIIATLQAAEQDIRQKMAALPRPAPVPRRKPPPPAAPSAGAQPSATSSPSPPPAAPPSAVQSSTGPPGAGVPRPPVPLH